MMKRHLKIMLAVVLALMIGAAALAEVRTTANVWMRAEPDKESAQITSLPEGASLEYLGETRVDDRGVAWYKVAHNGQSGWVSSRYSELIGEESAVAEPAPEPFETALPTSDPGSDWFTGAPAEGSVEVSVYYGADLMSAATELALPGFRKDEHSEVPNQYYDGALTLAGYNAVECIAVEGAGYTVFGVGVGMDAFEAAARLGAAGLDFARSSDGAVVFEHRAGASAAFADDNGHDSCISLSIEDRVVRGIDWSTYTG